jgi:hypothetical protein
MPFQAARTITSISNSKRRVIKVRTVNSEPDTGGTRIEYRATGSGLYMKPEIRKPVSETAFPGTED